MPASLLYEATKALTQEELSALGSNGLLELCALDRRFHPCAGRLASRFMRPIPPPPSPCCACRFEHSLFGPAAEGFMRGLQTAEATAKIDRTLSSFLQLLSPHFLHSAAHKALEFLIRRFEIHKYNMDAVLACVLPYHGTRWFVRMVQLLRLKETCWSWLQGKHGSSPPARATFVARCRKDARVLKQLCLLGLSDAREPCSRGRVAFTTVVVLEMLSASPSCSEVRLGEKAGEGRGRQGLRGGAREWGVRVRPHACVHACMRACVRACIQRAGRAPPAAALPRSHPRCRPR